MREFARELPDPKIVERGLWKGADIVTANPVIINHYQEVSVLIARENVPPDFPFSRLIKPWFRGGFIDRDYDLCPSVRSRYAQLGLNIDNNVTRQIGGWLRNNTHLDENGHFPNEITPAKTHRNIYQDQS